MLDWVFYKVTDSILEWCFRRSARPNRWAGISEQKVILIIKYKINSLNFVIISVDTVLNSLFTYWKSQCCLSLTTFRGLGCFVFTSAACRIEVTIGGTRRRTGELVRLLQIFAYLAQVASFELKDQRPQDTTGNLCRAWPSSRCRWHATVGMCISFLVVQTHLATNPQRACQDIWIFWRFDQFHSLHKTVAYDEPIRRECNRQTKCLHQCYKLSSLAKLLVHGTTGLQLHECNFLVAVQMNELVQSLQFLHASHFHL